MNFGKSRPESELYKPILDWLNVQQGVKAWRNRNVPAPNRHLPMHEIGAPDILGVKRKTFRNIRYGQAFALEVKREGRSARETQRQWLQEFVDCGGIAFIVSSLNDVIDVFEEI